MRIGVCCGLDWIEFAEADGFDFVELPVFFTHPNEPESVWAEVRKEILSHSIKSEVWNVLLPRETMIVGPDVDWHHISEYLQTVFDRVSQVNGKLVVFGSGVSRTVPDGFSFDTARKQIKHFLTLAGDFALAKSITLMIEPLNKTETNTIHTIADAVSLVTEVGHPAVEALADAYHMSVENDPIAEIEKSAAHIKHIHVADSGRLYPGSGDYDYVSLFDTLRQAGYDARVSCECGWGDDRRSAQQKSLQLLRQLQA